jgi:ADP-heptose:LPS heptosyltransferase
VSTEIVMGLPAVPPGPQILAPVPVPPVPLAVHHVPLTLSFACVARGALAHVPAGRPRVFLAMRSTNPDKHWPTDRWSAVIEWLVVARGCEVFFCGGPADVGMHTEVVSRLAPLVARHVHDHSASVPLRQVGGLLARMNLCVGVDSGLPHIAASHGVPVVALFGPTDPMQWHPWKTVSEVVCAAEDATPGRCSMRAISVEQVQAAAARLLGPQTTRQPDKRGRSSFPTSKSEKSCVPF